MKIVNQSVEVISSCDQKEALRVIERAGRVCYKSEDKIKDGSAEKLVRKLLESGHESVIEHYNVTLKFVTDRGCCYDEETKVLTDNGWKYFKDCTLDDKYATINDKNELLYVDAIRVIKEPFKGTMNRWSTTQIDLLVTPNHNMWVYDYEKRSPKTRTWKFIPSELCENGRYKFYKSCVPQNKETEEIEVGGCEVHRGFWIQRYPTIRMEANPFLELLGLWVTDGSISHGKNTSGNRIVISQKKESVRDEIRGLLKKLNIQFNERETEFRINSPQLFKYLAENFTRDGDVRKTYYLKLPGWFRKLGKENIGSFLHGVELGDGTKVTRSEQHAVLTASKDFAEDLVELYFLAGKCANIRYCEPRDRIFPNGGYVSKTRESYYVNSVGTVETVVCKNNMRNPFYEEYDGYVYCVELREHHKLYVMRNGKPCWCGNSHELVRHRLASYSQVSTRYCNYAKDKFGGEISVIKPNFNDEISEGIWKKSVKNAEAAYMDLVNNGVAPELARSVLPTCLATEIVMTCNLRQWRHVIAQRTSERAHPQIRELMGMALEVFRNRLPIFFEDFPK